MSVSKQTTTPANTDNHTPESPVKGTYDRLKKAPGDDVTYRGTTTADVTADGEVDTEGKRDTGHKYHGYGTLISVAFAFLLVFIGYVGTEALQTHINSEAGLGTTTVSIVYGCFYLSCFGFGPAVVGHFGPKWPVVIAWTCYTLFVVANFYPRTWTLYPAAALIGFAGGPVWISMGVYTTSLALEHAALNKKPREQVLSFFNGIFIGIFFFQFPISAFISSLVFIVADLYGGSGSHPAGSVEAARNLSSTTALFRGTTPASSMLTRPNMVLLGNRTRLEDGGMSHTLLHSNSSTMSTALPTAHAAPGSVCGASYCSYLSSHVAEIQKPAQVFIYINLAIFTSCVLLGMALLACQRSVRPPDHRYMPVKIRLRRLIQVLRDWHWLLLAPTFAVCGIMQGMAINTFSQAFVNCTLNIRWVAYVLTLRGLTCMTTSFISGKLAECIPQWVLLLGAYLIELVVLLVWLMWTPTVSLAWVFFIVQGAEGVGAGSLRVHATALLGYMFPSDQEVAFAHLNMVVALATCFIMAIANFLCFGAQTYLALGMLVVAMICYIVLKIWLHREEAELTETESRSNKSDEKKEDSLLSEDT